MIHEDELIERIDELYSDGNLSEMIVALGELEQPHPFIYFYGALAMISSICSYDDVDKVVAAWKNGLDLAWVKYTPEGIHQEVCSLIVKLDTAFTNRYSEIMNAVTRLLEQANAEIVELGKMILQQSNISVEGLNNISNHIRTKDSDVCATRDDYHNLASYVAKGKYEIISYYVGLYVENIIYNNDVEELMNVMGELIHEISLEYPDSEELKEQVEFYRLQTDRMKSIKDSSEYWNEHLEEKNSLLKQRYELRNGLASIVRDIAENDEKLNEIIAEKNKATHHEKVVNELEQLVSDKEAELGKIESSLFGVFKGNRKKALKEEVEEVKQKISETKKIAVQEREERDKQFASQINELKNRIGELQKRKAEMEISETRISNQLARKL